MRKVWSLAWLVRAAAAVIVSLVVLHPGVAEARWLRAESAKFVIYTDGDERYLRDYVAKLEEFDQILCAETGIDPATPVARKLDIYLVENTKEMRLVLPKAGDLLAGVYIESADDVFAVAIRNDRDRTDDNTVLHEYVHHFMLANFPYAYPPWLVEGWAEYFMTTILGKDYVEVGNFDRGRGETLLSGKWIPIQDVLSKRVSDFKDESALNFYAESWVMTHFFLSTPQRAQLLTRYMKAVGEGSDPVQAMKTVLGQDDLSVLDKAVHDYVRKGNIVSLRKPRTPWKGAITVTSLPPSADWLLLENQRLKNGIDKDDQAQVLANIRSRAAKFPGDRLADLALARAENDFGDRAAGEAILTRLIAANPTDAEALYLMGMSKMAAGDNDEANIEARYDEAGRFLVRAFKADPDRFQTLYAYARSRRYENDYPSQNVLEVLLRAHDLAPQVDEISIMAGQALIRKRRYDEAAVILQPVANNPHGGGAAQAAQSLLKQIASMRSVKSPG